MPCGTEYSEVLQREDAASLFQTGLGVLTR